MLGTAQIERRVSLGMGLKTNSKELDFFGMHVLRLWETERREGEWACLLKEIPKQESMHTATRGLLTATGAKRSRAEICGKSQPSQGKEKRFV